MQTVYPFDFRYDDPVVTWQFIGPVTPALAWKAARVESALRDLERDFGLEFREVRGAEERINIGIDLSDGLREGALGVARWMPDSGDGYIAISEMIDHPVTFEALATHEILHMLGADHVEGAEGASIMETPVGEAALELTPRDAASLEAAFPVTDSFLFARGEAREREARESLEAYAAGEETAFEAIKDLYLWALDRYPDAPGRAFWTERLEAGVDLVPHFAPHAEETWPAAPAGGDDALLA